MDNAGLLIGLIPARGGSKGIPRKNLRPLDGKPLIAHSIASGKACRALDYVVVSTEDAEIAEVAKSYGAEVPFMRPASFATDEAPMMPVMRHAVEACEKFYEKPVRAIVLLHPTSPLRQVSDVEAAIRLFDESGCDTVISGSPARCNPYFNMVEVRDGEARLVCELPAGAGRRQDAPPVYDLDGTIWIYSRRAIMDLGQRLPLKTKLYVVPEGHSHDLDTEEDWRFVEYRSEIHHE